MIFPLTSLTLSGDRFMVIYHLTGADEADIRAKVKGICLEQTVELPEELLPADDIRAEVVGRLERLQQIYANTFEAAISYAVETTGFELPQLLNVMFGNTSMQSNIRVVRLELPERLRQSFKGPRFGQAGLRALTQAYGRPLLCTALKPMGLSTKNLAHLTSQFALGGIDLIKDDHGLANQPFHPFHERVRRCAEAVNEANQKTGYHCLYVPNITAPAQQIVERAYFAKEAGAGGVMIVPGLVGLDWLRVLAEDDKFGLPILSHPAYWGTYVTSLQQGVAHRLTYGLLPRLAGADATIFVNYGGRFSFTQDDCQGIVAGTNQPMGHLKSIFPIPAGGMTLDRLAEMVQFYGLDVIFLMAGGLYGYGPDLRASCQQFRERVSSFFMEDSQ